MDFGRQLEAMVGRRLEVDLVAGHAQCRKVNLSPFSPRSPILCSEESLLRSIGKILSNGTNQGPIDGEKLPNCVNRILSIDEICSTE